MKYINFILLYFLVSCAQQTPLTGGQKDVTPPQLDSLRTHPSSLATSFNEKEVELVFNENIQVGNGKRDLITSPTIYQLETNVVKNKLIIKWKDSLSINTTYQIYFPNSIADLTEKNTLSNFKFVFSTGDKIENGKYEGEIIEMPHDRKGEGYLVHLKHVSDTLLNYKTYSNKDGVFEFDFIQPGHYLIGGFNDENNNYELDSLTENVFFNIDTITIIADSLLKGNQVSFKPVQKVNIEKSSLDPYGKITLEFNQTVDSCSILDTISQVSFHSLKKAKTHTFFINDTLDKYFLLVTSPKQNFSKKMILANTEKKPKEYQLTFKEKQEKKWKLSKRYQLHFNQYLKEIDTSKIILLQDSIKLKGHYTRSGEILTIDPGRYGQFKLVLLPNSIIGLKSTKDDTSTIHFNIKKDQELGELELIIDSLMSSNYILNISKNDKIVDEISFKGNHFKMSFNRIDPGDYTLQIIQDKDNNQYWSTGDIFEQIQPEKIFHYEGNINIKKNWTTSIKWMFNTSM